ncbi:hypothetical protein [Comamonas sp.]|uniref:hypothetical protein n=1 Tax=Comamonas sp. TaxID=34028 RepID=UPI0025BB2F32|nr:hypothetical protein [Comamonas sp.]
MPRARFVALIWPTASIGWYWLVWIVGSHDALSARIYWAERIAPILLFGSPASAA